MATIERIKTEIHEATDSVPMHELPQLLDHINTILAKYPTKEELNKAIDRIFKEDHNLLKRLADS